MNDYKFGNFVYMLRERKGLTQADVAARLGVTAAAVSKWETGSSKPRVEVLFQLAELLGVRSEELMAGQFLESENLDPDAVRRINERYAYLQRIDSYDTVEVKMRRVIAALLDWWIIGFSVLVVFAVLHGTLFYDNTVQSRGELLFYVWMILSYPLCFSIRDFLMGGRSLGKRITGLVVLNKETGERATVWQRLFRCFSFLAMEIDLVLVLATGLSIGDRLARTVVVSKKELQAASAALDATAEEINHYETPEEKLIGSGGLGKKATVWISIGVVALWLVSVLLMLLILFLAEKGV